MAYPLLPRMGGVRICLKQITITSVLLKKDKKVDRSIAVFD